MTFGGLWTVVFLVSFAFFLFGVLVSFRYSQRIADHLQAEHPEDWIREGRPPGRNAQKEQGFFDLSFHSPLDHAAGLMIEPFVPDSPGVRNPLESIA